MVPHIKMIKYFTTKHTQDILFEKFREVIMEVTIIKNNIKENETKNKIKWIFGP